MLTYEVNTRTASKDSKETFSCLLRALPTDACEEAVSLQAFTYVDV
jgi:hypothetical protein